MTEHQGGLPSPEQSLELSRLQELQRASEPYYNALKEQVSPSVGHNALSTTIVGQERLHEATADLQLLEDFGGLLPPQWQELDLGGEARARIASDNRYGAKVLQAHTVRCAYGSGAIFAFPLGAKRLDDRYSEVVLLAPRITPATKGGVYGVVVKSASYAAMDEFSREELRTPLTQEQLNAMSTDPHRKIYLLPAEGVPELRIQGARIGAMGTTSDSLTRIKKHGIQAIFPKQEWGFDKDHTRTNRLRRLTPDDLVARGITYDDVEAKLAELSVAFEIKGQLLELARQRHAFLNTVATPEIEA